LYYRNTHMVFVLTYRRRYGHNNDQDRRWNMIKLVCAAAMIGILFFLASCASMNEPPSVTYPTTGEDPRNYSTNPMTP